MAPTPPPASSRASLASPYKQTITYLKKDRARATGASHHPSTLSPPVPQTSSASNRNTASSRSARKEVIDLSNDDSDAAIAATVEEKSASRAEIRKQLADVLKELSATKQEVKQYEAATEDENTCELCLGIIWQPCVLPCGHALCAECLYDYTYLHLKAGHQLHSTTCAYCRAPISRPPVLALEWQDRVDDMALARGIPIPKRTDFQWPPPPDTPTRLRPAKI